MFETTLGGDASHNTLDTGASYFNPKNDHSLWLTAAVENLTWRNYERSFRQRLALTGGRYWQEYYRTGLDRGHRIRPPLGTRARPLPALRHRAQLFRPYDGTREARTFANMNVLWRF